MKKPYKLVVAGGKGGTGKTTIAVNLAVSAADSADVHYLDCDVEEPNGHIFLRPDIDSEREINVPVPQVDHQKCTACGRCGQLCQYSAIALFGEKVMTFEELCHCCGGCMEVCPAGAITEKLIPVGVSRTGMAGKVKFSDGLLKIADVRTTSVIKAVKAEADSQLSIIDAAPGTSCAAVETVKDADYVLMVTEPTPFGLNDLELAIGMVRKMEIPFSVVINRDGMGDDGVAKYCGKEGIDVALEVPDDIEIARMYSRGELIAEQSDEYRKLFERLAERFTVMQ